MAPVLTPWVVAGALAAQPHVLIKADATLHTQPGGDHPRSRLEDRVDLEEEPHRVVYAELVERKAGWATVRTTTYQRACHPPLGRNAPSGLLLYVRGDDLVPVTTRPFELQGSGGTRVQVHTGLAARNNVDATWTVAAKGLQVTAFMPDDAIGAKFVPSPAPKVEFNPSHGATADFGDAKVRISAKGAPAMPAGDGLWTLHRRCLTATGPLVDGDAPQPGGGTPDTRGGSARRSRNITVVQPGTVLRWPDGVYAGTATALFRLKGSVADHAEGLSCGTVLKGLPVCVADPEGKPPPLRYPVVNLKPRNQSAPKHPKGDVKDQTAKCEVEVHVDRQGHTTGAEATGCAEPFQKAAEEAVMTWTWTPHEVGGKPVLARTWTTVKFQ